MRKHFKDRALAGVLAVVTALSPISSSLTAYAAEDNLGASIIETEAATEVSSEGLEITADSDVAEVAVGEEMEAEPVAESYKISIDLASANGSVTVTDANGAQTARISEDANGKTVVSVKKAGSDAESQAVLTNEQPYALVVEAEAGTTVNVKAEADDGYEVATYAVTMDSGASFIPDEEVGFKDGFISFEYDVLATEDRVVTVDFAELPEAETTAPETEDIVIEEEETSATETEATEISTETDIPETDVTVEEGTEAAVETETTEVPVETEAETELETETATEAIEIESETETAAETADSEIAVETETESEAVEVETEVMTEAVETETEAVTEMAETETDALEVEDAEHFLEDEAGTENLNASDFSSKRLVILAESEEDILDPEHIQTQYGEIYVMQYDSVQQAMNAYVYYQANALAVEPDRAVTVASDNNTMGSVDTAAGEAETNLGLLIALIDTGAQLNGNVIAQASVIDDVMYGNGHGDAMAAAITSVNPGARILSIRAMDNSGHGTLSSIVSAMEYAMNNGAQVINLSLYSRKSLMDSVLTAQIQKAVEAGITVVAAAGNDGDDAANYMPGCVDEAYVIGACDDTGVRISSSNFGATVDYNVVASSTSEAAAKFSGYVSMLGLPIQDVNENGLVFTNGYEPATDIELPSDLEDADYINGVVKPEPFYIALPWDTEEGFEDSFALDKDFAFAFAEGIDPEDYEVEVESVDEDFDKNTLGTYEVTYTVTPKDGGETLTVTSALVVTNYLTEEGLARLADELGIANQLDEKGQLNPQYLANSKYPGDPNQYVDKDGYLPNDYYDTSIPYFENKYVIFGSRDWYTGEELYASDVIDFGDSEESDFMAAYNCGHSGASLYGSGSGTVVSAGKSVFSIRMSSGPLSGRTITMNCHAHTAASLYTGQGGTYKYYSDGYVHFVTPGTCTGAMNGLGLTGYQCAAAKVNPPKITLKLTKTNANPDATSEITTKSGYPAETVKNIKKRYKLKATFGVYETKEDARANKNRVAKIETDSKGSDTITFDNDEAGTYYIRELTAPTGMYLDTTIKKVTLKSGKTSTVTFEDEPMLVPLTIKKTDSSGQVKADLAGTRFAFYVDAECSKRARFYSPEEKKWYALPSIVVGEDGIASTKDGDWFEGADEANLEAVSKIKDGAVFPLGATIYIKEVKATSNYVLREDPVKVNFTIASWADTDEDENIIGWSDKIITFANNAKTGPTKLRVVKSATTANEALTQLNGATNPLYENLSADFVVCNASGTPITDQHGKNITFHTNADGTSAALEITTVDPNSDDASDATKNLTYLKPGTYYMKETKAPANYAMSNCSSTGTNLWPFTIPTNPQEGQIITAYVQDDPVHDPSVLIIRKQDKNAGTTGKNVGSQSLDGAEFKLSYWAVTTPEGSTAIPSGEPDKVWTYKTINGGILDIGDPACKISGEFIDTEPNGLGIFPVGTYVLEETKAPSGFVQPSADQKVVLVGHNNHTAGQASSTFTWTADSTLIGYNASQGYVALYEPAIYTDIAIQKQDAELKQNGAAQGDASLAGITFGIWNMNSNSVFVNGQEFAAGTEITALRMITNASGYATTKGIVEGGALPVGKYEIREISTNASMQRTDTAAVAFSVTDTGVVMPDGSVVAFNENTPPVVVRYNTDPYTARNAVVEGGLEAQKVDANLGENLPSGDATLEGTVFYIVNASAGSVVNKDGKVIPKANLSASPTYEEILAAANAGSLVQAITTNAQGYASTGSTDLPYGTYYVIEAQAPEGYVANTEWIQKVEIRTQGTIVSLLDNPCADPPIKGGAKVQKFDYMRDTDKPHGDADLSGAEFTIVNASSNTCQNVDGEKIPSSGLPEDVTYAQVRAAANKSTMQVLTTDASGDAQTGANDLPYGTYYIIETKAPEGYSVNTEWIGEVIIREDGVIYEPAVIRKGIHDEDNHTEDPSHDVAGSEVVANDGHSYAVCDQIYRSGISIDKIDLEMGDATRQGEGTLEGAEFTILNASKASIRNKDGKDIPTAEVSETPTYAELREIADAGKNTVQVITTNKQGHAATGYHDLPYGTYYVIETKSSEGYFIDDTFVGKVTVRDDGLTLNLGTTEGNSSFIDINDEAATTVDQQVRRNDLSFLKVNIDGEYKAYIPFLISAIRVNPDGSETVLESHVIVSDENGYVNTARKHSENTNGFDQYIDGDTVTPEGEKLLKEASTWGIWFEGNRDDYPKDAVNDNYGALYDCHYRITELHCEDNKELGENLLNSDLIEIKNDTADLTELLKDNADMTIYHPLVDTEITLTSKALDTESGTKTLPARESVEIQDTVEYTHVSSDHKYRLAVQFRDLTDGGKVIKVQGTNDEGAYVSDDGAWVMKEFQPAKQSGTNNTYGEISVTALLNTKALNGHTIMAVDYLYEYIDITDNDMVPGDWVLVKIHPDEGEVDEEQCVYVPDLKTKARDAITGDRLGAKSADDAIIDEVSYTNLSKNEQYVITMTLMDRKTGQPIVANEDGSAKEVVSDVIFKRSETPVSGSITMPEFTLDSSSFEDGMAAVVTEALYRADENGQPMGEPIMEHDSLLDEDQTIRWADIKTSASDKNTADDVGTSEEEAVVYDNVMVSNVIFDDNDHDGQYSYTIKGRLVYQKDFVDANGVSHKAGEEVETLEGTKDVVTVTSDAAGNATFTYADGTQAEGKVTIKGYGLNVANSIGGDAADNSYITDNTAAIADFEVEMIYRVDSSKLEGGTVVVFESLYHDAAGGSDTEVARHEDLMDEGQTVHYPKVRTSAVDNSTADDVGAVMENATITDTVTLTNLVPGREYTVKGILKNQETGEDFLVDGKPVTQSASLRVTEDGQIVAGNGEKVTVTSYDAERKEVCGTIDLTFTFDATGLEDKTCVVFEDLYHKGIKVAAHNDLTDESQTIHFPKIETTLEDGYTGDHVGTVSEEAVLVDTVKYHNLVPGREYTVSGVLMDKDTGDYLTDRDGDKIIASTTFIAGEEGDGITITEYDKEHNKVSGTVEVVFRFDGSLLEGKTTVAFEDLYHEGKKVTSHTDIEDEDQTVHFPKLRTSAMDGNVGDEVGKVDETTIVDKVRFWNLIPGMEYEVYGTLMDKATGEPLLVNGETVTQEAVIKVGEDGTVTSGNGEKVTVLHYDKENNYVNGTIELTFTFDASALENIDVVVFEDLYHNGIKVTAHADIEDLGQTVHFPKIRTEAIDTDTGDHTGTVGEEVEIKDTVKYENLVIGKTYTLKGTLMNQETGAPVVNPDGTLVTAEATFEATTAGSDVNKVTAVHEDDATVDGEYTLVFKLDSRQLAGTTVVVFEDLYHNDVKVTTHADIHDHEQSVHYPQIHTTATDINTGDHVGSIWGALINGIRQFFGETDADGNGIPDDAQANIVDTVTLINLLPGQTYVVSGKLYDAGASEEAGEAIPLLIDGEEITQAVTITISEDGKSITTSNGEKAAITAYDETCKRVDATVDLTYTLDSSKIQGVETVVFEKLYHDITYTTEINPADVKEEDIIHVHEDYTDEGQSVSEVGVHTTAIDVETGTHVGAVPQEGGVSVIHDEVNMTKLVPGMEYTIKGVLVDIGSSDMENGKPMYLKTDGTLTEDREEAYTETYQFTAEKAEEKHYLNFALSSDKVMGRSLTVFEDLYHGDVKITSHPAGDGEGWDEEAIANQTVYYPAGKTNATDYDTGDHMSIADSARTIKDRVYFENLLVGEEYEIRGQLVYQSDFTDANGVSHKAGDPLGNAVAVKFTAEEGLTSVPYTEVSGSVEQEGGNGLAAVDSLKVTTFADGQKAISGYVTLEFIVDARALEGATIVAFETFHNNGAEIFVHEDLNDFPQTIRIPKIRTTAKVDGIDEASIYDENGNFRTITLTDTVSYENLWTQAQLDAMREQGMQIIYEDGTTRPQDGVIYDIGEQAQYILKGVLMDVETGEPLTDSKGNTYTVYSDAFTPEAGSGTHDVVFTLNLADFVGEDGTCLLEGKTIVVFEDLYMTGSREEAENGSHHIGTHHDLEDEDQDIRFPKVRTHATDGIPEDILSGASGGYITILEDGHNGEANGNVHEAFANGEVTITDYVAYENLHGGTKYTVTGTLQVVTGYDENGVPNAWEPALDDNGNVITVTETLDTSAFSKDYEESVSGYIPLTFTFSGVNLAGKTTVVFEDVKRDGVTVAVHADITDDAQTIYFPQIHTNASDIESGLDETLASENAVILDRVTYDNLEAGKTYTLSGVLYRKSDGKMLEESEVTGTFVAGEADQYIAGEGIDGEEYELTAEVSEPVDGRVSGEVYVILPIDATELGGDTVVVFEALYAERGDGSWKEVAEHADIEDEGQSVDIPLIHTNAEIGGKKEEVASKSTTVVDTITYEGLTPGREYTVYGELMDQNTGEATGITSETTFTPEEEDGTVEVTFKFDSTGYAGHKLVVFEEIVTEGEDGEEYPVAEHKDIEDAAQTVTILVPPAPPSIKTGDFPVWGYLAGAAVLAALAVGLCVYRRKKKD